MKNLRVELDWNKVQEREDFALLPAGYYKAMILGYDKKTKKNADPNSPYYYIELKVKVIEGTYREQVILHKLNICNPNEEVMKWHQGILKKLFRLCGHPDGTTYDQLLGIPIMIQVKIRPFSKTNEKMINEIESYLEINDALLAIKYAFPIQQTTSQLVKELDLNDDIPF
ncbi:MAG TPA: DUF669 domain-containing protein [Rummeliibacillus sp.]|nr:DUF669 domain-containing protein [Rummeliibacillus sp.]